MTDRFVSWTDAESVAALLSRVSAQVPRGAVGRMGFGAAPLQPVQPRVVPVAAQIVAVEEPKVVPRLEQTSDNPSDRLDALVAWTLDHQKCTGAFVADDNGLTLAAHGISEAHVSLVGPMLSALLGIRSIPGIDATAGALWLGASMMSWVETRTARGGFCLGALGPEALSRQAFEQLREALEITMQGL